MNKSGAELIAEERQEQIFKHGRTVEKDISDNSECELLHGAIGLLLCDENEMPINWDEEICLKMIKKSYRDRLIIAGALVAAELDRLMGSCKHNNKTWNGDIGSFVCDECNERVAK